MAEYLDFTTRIKFILSQKPLEKNCYLVPNQTKKWKVFWPKQGPCWISGFKTQAIMKGTKRAKTMFLGNTSEPLAHFSLCVCVFVYMCTRVCVLICFPPFLCSCWNSSHVERQEPLRLLEHCDFIVFLFSCEMAEYPLWLELFLQKQNKPQLNNWVTICFEHRAFSHLSMSECNGIEVFPCMLCSAYRT